MSRSGSTERVSSVDARRHTNDRTPMLVPLNPRVAPPHDHEITAVLGADADVDVDRYSSLENAELVSVATRPVPTGEVEQIGPTEPMART